MKQEMKKRKGPSGQYVDRIIEVLIVLLVILVPLVFSRHLTDSFSLPKSALAQFLIFEMALLALIGMTLRRKYTLPRSPLLLPLCVFLGLETASLLWAENIHVGLGLLLQDVAFGLLVFVVLYAVRTEKFFRKLVLTTILTACLGALLGIMQYFKLDVFSLFPGGEGMIFSTIGHRNFLAAYLIVVAPSALMMIMVSNTQKRRAVFGLISALLLFVLLLTKSRGAWLGWVGACFVLLVGFVSFYRRRMTLRRERVLHWIVGGLTILLLVVVIGGHILSLIRVGRDGSTVREWVGEFAASTTGRAVSAFYVNTGTALYRRIIWIPTLRMIGENPLIGVGKDNFQITYPKYIPETYKERLGILTYRGTKVHNEYLQVLAELGFAGFLAFVWFIYSLVRTGIFALKRYRDEGPDRYFLSLGLLAGVVAILMHSLVSNPLRIPASSLHFWLFAGLIGAAARFPGASSVTDGTVHRPVTVRGNLRAVILALLAGVMVLIPFVISRPVVADYYVRKGNACRDRELYGEAIQFYEKAFSFGCRDSEVYRNVGRIYFRHKEYDAAIEQWEKDLQVNPHFPRTYHYLGSAYAAKGDVKKSEEMLRTALQIYPGYDDVRQGLRDLYLYSGAGLEEKGLIDQAIETYLRALQMFEDDGLFHFRLGRLYYESGKAGEAVRELEMSVKKDPDLAAAYEALGHMYARSSEPQRALAYYRRYLKLSPHSPHSEAVEEEMRRIRTSLGFRRR